MTFGMRYDLFVCTVVFCIWVLALFKYAFRLLFILSLLKKQTAQIIDFRFLCNFFLDFLYIFLILHVNTLISIKGRHGRDHMVVGFTTTYAISAYRH